MQNDRSSFEAAIRSGDVSTAVRTAGALAPLDLTDAPELLRVLAEAGDDRYPA